MLQARSVPGVRPAPVCVTNSGHVGRSIREAGIDSALDRALHRHLQGSGRHAFSARQNMMLNELQKQHEQDRKLGADCRARDIFFRQNFHSPER
jgi:hypothetical protein